MFVLVGVRQFLQVALMTTSFGAFPLANSLIDADVGILILDKQINRRRGSPFSIDSFCFPGIGNSAADIAVDLSRTASEVSHASLPESFSLMHELRCCF